MSQEAESAEKFFGSGEKVSTFSLNLAQMREKSSDLSALIEQETIPHEVKSVVKKAIENKDNPTDIEKSILEANACNWQWGPCGSCYNDKGRYAYAVSCDGGPWQYGCGYCT